MNEIIFEGQQSDERVLYTIIPHEMTKRLATLRNLVLAILLFLVFLVFAAVIPTITSVALVGGIVVAGGFFLATVWWNKIVYERAKAYITDRRIIRFEQSTPFVTTKRTLFWNEVLKAKAYAPNLLYRMFRIGIVEIEPNNVEHEDVTIHNVRYFEDLANYIDKILFTFKNKPGDLGDLRPFVPKPRGQRD